ncbi:protein tyrosine kinase domain-containing protein [Ditylenchus destructor]|uniref:Protein tyrosine kinase domain-containing protein n=1 Tax=Ditylenchus destructor TaxID=166010 RepID=A0AAD4NER5_9BILA|nr:protein tyrosine kinase domain-containing protein [Ditylenchus destructor]
MLNTSATCAVLSWNKTCPHPVPQEQCTLEGRYNSDFDPDALFAFIPSSTQQLRHNRRKFFHPNTFELANNDDVTRCSRIYLLDVAAELVEEDEFEKLKDFLYYSMKSCLDDEIGHMMSVIPVFHKENRKVCCSLRDCQDMLQSYLHRENFVFPYNNMDPVWNHETFASTDYNASHYFLEIYADLMNERFSGLPCSKNSMVWITNRVVDMQEAKKELQKLSDGAHEDEVFSWFFTLFDYFCAAFTIIVVGRPELSVAQIYEQYGNFTKRIFSVPDFNCLSTELIDCLTPCGSGVLGDDRNWERYDSCSQKSFFKCPNSPPMPTLPPSPTPTVEPYQDSMRILYVFALSKNITQEQFTNIKNAVQTPIIKNHYEKGIVLSLAIIFPYTSAEIPWIYDANSLVDQLENAAHLNSILEVSDLMDSSSSTTSEMVRLARHKYEDLESSHNQESVVTPRIVLITDFVSLVFETNHTAENLVHRGDIDVRNASDSSLIIPVDPSDDIRPTQPTIPSGIPAPRDETLFFVGLAVALFASVVVLAALVFAYRRKLMRMMKLERFRAHHEGDKGKADGQAVITDFWELSWDKLLIKNEKLGSGAYGQVFRGIIHGKPPCVDYVYQNRPNSLLFDLEDCDMKSLSYNENIVNMLGCITVGQTICLVLEYCPNKDLLTFVSNLKEEMMEQRFLGTKGIVHRDLAARNILIDAERNAKICDFGLCITTNYKTLPIAENNKPYMKISTSGRLPIKWLAIECLKRQEFTSKSDVWCFGILLYEMYSFGATPFEEIQPNLLLAHLEEGNRPEKTEYCPDEIYDIMAKCWYENPEERPSFQELLTLFTVLLERATEGYGYLSLLRANTEHYARLSKVTCSGHAQEYRESMDRRRSSLKPAVSTARISIDFTEKPVLSKVSEDHGEDRTNNSE